MRCDLYPGKEVAILIGPRVWRAYILEIQTTWVICPDGHIRNLGTPTANVALAYLDEQYGAWLPSVEPCCKILCAWSEDYVKFDSYIDKPSANYRSWRGLNND